MLRATGPIKVGEETFTADNVVRKLLNEVYQRFETREQQDAYFDRGRARHLRHPGHRATSSQLKVAARSSARPADQRRFLVWSSHARGAAQIAGHRGRGRAARATPATSRTSGCTSTTPRPAKIEYYLDYAAVDPLGRAAPPRASRPSRSGMVLDSSAPRRGVRALPATSPATAAYAPKGDMRLNLRIYAPHGRRDHRARRPTGSRCGS